MKRITQNSHRFPPLISGAAVLAAAFVSLLMLRCSQINGGGTDIGNPSISGTVLTVDAKPAAGASVVLGSIDRDAVLDSVTAGKDGKFLFSKVPLGLYAVTAGRDYLLAIARVVHDSGVGTSVSLTLDRPATIRLLLDSMAADTAKKLDWARIAGTQYRFTRAAAADFRLDRAPAGEMDIMVATAGGPVYALRNFHSIAACDAYIIVDPSLPPEKWISGGCGVRDPLAAPFVTWAAPPSGSRGVIARVNQNAAYDVALQFSHPMNTRATLNAITGGGTDTTAKISSMWWQGSDVLYIKFNRGVSQMTAASQHYPVGVTYYVRIDTSAESVFGVHFAKRQRFSFTPEPEPRLIAVQGFRFASAASSQAVDSFPPVVSLGDSVSPSIAQIDGNTLRLTFNGTPLQSAPGVSCFESDTIPVQGVTIEQSANQVAITFKSLLKSGTSYCVVIDTSLRFKEGIPLSHNQTVRWKTIRFTINTALLLGLTLENDTMPVPLIGQAVPRKYNLSPVCNSYSPNLPATTWYASNPVDSASVKKNVIIPAIFSALPLITEQNKFGFIVKTWLPPAKKIEFKILPGLKTAAGDSLGDTLTYSVRTDSFSMKEYNVFNLYSSTVGGHEVLPRQDSVYNLDLCTFSNSSGYSYDIASYTAWVNFNAPLDSSSAGKFSITPDGAFSFCTVHTGLERYSNSMLRPDTTYVVKLEKGIVDSFGNTAADTFVYRFRTEKFRLKIGNLFGAYFGYPQEIAHLPAQILPDITIVNQNVEPGNPYTWVIGDESFVFPNPSSPVIQRQAAYDHAGILISNTPIGIRINEFRPGFDTRYNYLCFSGIPDAIAYRNHVSITPDDGSLLFKVDGNKLRFSTSAYCRAKTLYAIKIDKNFPDQYGHTLGDTISVGFTTPALSVISATLNGKTALRDTILKGKMYDSTNTRGFGYAVVFNYPELISSLEKNITVQPPVQGRLTASVAGASFTASKILIPDTLYCITLNTGITDRYGSNLDTTYMLRFRTRPFAVDELEIGTVEGGELFSLASNSLLDTTTILSSIHVSPGRYARGRYVLSADSTGFSFIPDSLVRLGDAISVVVDTNLKDRYNHHFRQPDSLAYIVAVENK